MSTHGYGDTSDCICGRNFATVRGLREHMTKARASVCSCGHQHDNRTPRWETDPIAKMLDVAQYGCRCCGEDAIAERDRTGGES